MAILERGEMNGTEIMLAIVGVIVGFPCLAYGVVWGLARLLRFSDGDAAEAAIAARIMAVPVELFFGLLSIAATNPQWF